MRDVLGGKGANLAEMASLKLPVPPGFTISTGVCNYFYEHEHQYPKGLAEGVKKSVARIEKAMEHKFGDATNPLLVSVRSGARVSMPGMMDTVLNLGLTDETVKGLATASGNAALRLGFLSPFLPDVRRRCAEAQAREQGRSRSVRGIDRAKKGAR